jgi:hypothetical protein
VARHARYPQKQVRRGRRRASGLNHDELDRVVSTPLPESDEELVAAFPPSRKKDRTSEFGGPQAVGTGGPFCAC